MAASTPDPNRPQAWRRVLRMLPYVLAALALFSMFAPAGRSGPPVGQLGADFDLPSLVASSDRVTLSQFRGRPLLIEAFASWCGACRGMAPSVAAASRAGREPAVEFLAVAVNDDPEQARAAVREWGIPFPVALDDGRFASEYSIRVLPTFVLLGADGQVLRVVSGPLSPRKLDALLREAENPPS